MFKKSSIEEFGNSIISWMQRKYNILHLGVLACMWLVVLLVQKKKTRRNRISISLKGSTACFCSVLSALIQTKLKNYQPHHAMGAHLIWGIGEAQQPSPGLHVPTKKPKSQLMGKLHWNMIFWTRVTPLHTCHITGMQINVSFLCICPVIDNEFCHNIVKVAVDPWGDSRVDYRLMDP